MNQKAKPHKQSLVVGGQNGIQVLDTCRFAREGFGNKGQTLIALYYGKIYFFT